MRSQPTPLTPAPSIVAVQVLCLSSVRFFAVCLASSVLIRFLNCHIPLHQSIRSSESNPLLQAILAAVKSFVPRIGIILTKWTLIVVVRVTTTKMCD